MEEDRIYSELKRYFGFTSFRPLQKEIEEYDVDFDHQFLETEKNKRFFERIEQKGLTVNRFRADCGSPSTTT